MSSGTYQSKETKNESATTHSAHQQSGAAAFQLKDNRPETVAQRRLQETISKSPQVQQLKAYQEMADNASPAVHRKENNTGLPYQLKSGVESLGGMSLDHVKVHYNSDKPAQLNAHAYAQGSDIHLAPGQEKHLPHEAWHVVQQAQGRVKPTMQLKAGVPVNDDSGLEREADVMGAKALGHVTQKKDIGEAEHAPIIVGPTVVQRAKTEIGGGIAMLYTPAAATTTAYIFSHGVYHGETNPVAGATLNYFCPHHNALTSNLGLMGSVGPYSADAGPANAKWHNYTLSEAKIGLKEADAQNSCDTSGAALAEVKSATTTANLVKVLKDLGYTTIHAIHCREVFGEHNDEWDPITDSAIVIEQATQIITRDSLNGLWDFGGGQAITAATNIAIGFIYMPDEDTYTGKAVTAVNGTNLTVTNYP